MGLLPLIGVGFLLGMRHATDSDHVIAVSTIVSRNKSFGKAWILGAFWGLGHSLTIFLVGAAIITYRVQISPRFGLSMEFGVGIMLVVLGLLNLASDSSRRSDPPGRRAHRHSGPVKHFLARLEELNAGVGAPALLKAGLVGLIHGLAGSAAVALLVLSVIPEPRAAVIYLILFGAGTLAGMLSLSAAMEFSMVHAIRRWQGFERVLSAATGGLSLAFGIYILYQVGFVDGLIFG